VSVPVEDSYNIGSNNTIRFVSHYLIIQKSGEGGMVCVQSEDVVTVFATASVWIRSDHPGIEQAGNK
jgi:hypothetical protein